MAKKATKKPTKSTEVRELKPYTIGLGFKDPKLVEELQLVLGKQQYGILMDIFESINKFTQTTVTTILPDLLKQIHSVVYNERLRLIQANVAAEEGREIDSPVASDEVELLPTEEA